MKIVVVGGGAGGMAAALYAAKNGAQTVLIERNEKLGKKIYITGKGRCNLTNDCAVDEFLANVVSNPKFLSSALYSFKPADTINFFQENGLELKTERGNRVFPKSEKASDVTKCLEKCLNSAGVEILLNTAVTGIVVKQGRISAVKTQSGCIECDKVILSTGGITYPATGSDGSGLNIAKNLGHNIIPLKGALVGLRTETVSDAAGLTLKNVNVRVMEDCKVFAEQFGEMLFTHTGISGPAVLTLSSKINRIEDFKNCFVEIDLKPALNEKELDLRLQRDFKENINKQFINSLNGLIPSSLVDAVVKKSGIEPLTRINNITAEQRGNLLTALKHFRLNLFSLENIDGAVVSAGGVDTKEINPSTMESKLIQGLYFAGEMIDVDALTGGFNLQIAFSTGVKAGIMSARE